MIENGKSVYGFTQRNGRKALGDIYLRSGLIERVSPKPGDIRCDGKNKLLSLWPNELFTFGAEPLRWLNGSDILNMFVWFVGLKLFNELPGMFTGADVPCNRPAGDASRANRLKSILERKKRRHLPEMEFDSCEPGMVTGGVEFCKMISSKFDAANGNEAG